MASTSPTDTNIDHEDPMFMQPTWYSFFPPVDKDGTDFTWAVDVRRSMANLMWNETSVTSRLEEHDAKYLASHTLPGNMRAPLLLVLAFFSQADSRVGANILENFIRLFPRSEIAAVYRVQAVHEDVHALVYDLLLRFYATPQELSHLRMAAFNLPAVQMKMDLIKEFHESNMPPEELVVVFGGVEGILFASAFLYIAMLKRLLAGANLQGLFEANEYIMRDESKHADFACMMLSKMRRKPSAARIASLLKRIAETEFAFAANLVDAAGGNIEGLELSNIILYIKAMTDRLMVCMGVPRDSGLLYGAENPFPEVCIIGMVSVTNFFERENPSDYMRYDVPVTTMTEVLAEKSNF